MPPAPDELVGVIVGQKRGLLANPLNCLIDDGHHLRHHYFGTSVEFPNKQYAGDSATASSVGTAAASVER